MEKTLFDHLRNLQLPAGDYAVFGSGPLAARGIIPSCNDLDVLCRGHAWQMVRALGTVEYLQQYEVEIVTMLDGAMTFGTRWGIGEFQAEDLIDSAELIDGLPFVRLEHVLAYKEIRASEKDRRHIEAVLNSGYLNS
mgnify:FL=1